MTVMNDDQFRALAAKAMHDVEPTPGIEIDVTVTEDCGTLVDSVHMYSQIMPHHYTGKPALSVLSSVHGMELHRVEELIALLQRARQIMGGGA